jgi:putative redox protein
MSSTATARRIGDSLSHEIDVNRRHTIVTDEPASLGGTDQGPAPHELLAAAFAGCVGTMIALYGRRHGWALDETMVEVEYDHESVPRQLSLVVTLPEHLSAEQVKRLRRVAQTCPLRRSLEAGFAFEERFVGAPVPV